MEGVGRVVKSGVYSHDILADIFNFISLDFFIYGAEIYGLKQPYKNYQKE